MALPGSTFGGSSAGSDIKSTLQGTALFIGETPDSYAGVRVLVTPETDLAATFGAASNSKLTAQLPSAMANGDDNWHCYAIGHKSTESWSDVIDAALNLIEVETIVILEPVSSGAEIDALEVKAVALENIARLVTFVCCTPGIDAGTETWSAYETAQKAIVNGKVAPHVMITPLILGNGIGVLLGQLQRSKVHQSMARTKTGALLLCGNEPIDTVDSDGVILSLALLEQLADAGFTVIRWYEDYPGLYFSRGKLLEAPGGDFPYIEWKRVTDKLRRACRIIGLQAIGDEEVDNSPSGIATFKLKLLAPAKVMERAGEIKPMTTADITITWSDQETVVPVVSPRPINAPHQIPGIVNLNTAFEEEAEEAS